jgi:hypothetical protein
MKLKLLYLKDKTIYPSEQIAIGIARHKKQVLRGAGYRNALEIQTRYKRDGELAFVILVSSEKKIRLIPKQAPNQIDNQ